MQDKEGSGQGGSDKEGQGQDNLNNRNRRTTIVLVGIVICMGGLAFAAVPLYEIFCQVTGYGGTPQLASACPTRCWTVR